MKSLTCVPCAEIIDEADRRWDTLKRTGTCPKCGSSTLAWGDFECPADLRGYPTAELLRRLQRRTSWLHGAILILLGLAVVAARQLPPPRGVGEAVTGFPAFVAGGVLVGMGIYSLLPRSKTRVRS